ncbi:MAG: hypothetical protein ACKVJ6_07840 [Flavobacteriales bacterium]
MDQLFKLLRKFSSVIIGIIIGGFVTFFIERLGHENISAYQDVPNMIEKDAFADFISNLPVIAFLILLLAHSVGTMVSGGFATLFSGESRPVAATAVGAIMLGLGILNFIAIPSHPVWYMICEAIVYLPSALIGHSLFLKIKGVLT